MCRKNMKNNGQKFSKFSEKNQPTDPRNSMKVKKNKHKENDP